MYPHDFFALFPPFPRTRRAFVAMSFAPEFEGRWEEVIRPGLKSVSVDGQALEPFRVDLSRVSDAILTEILSAISDSTVIFADITSTAELNGRPIRNGNVMYEVGLAHATRLAEEVILFRSDRHHLDFDIAGVRVHDYSPEDDPEASRQQVANAVVDSLSALEARRRSSLRTAAQRLTLPAMLLLFETLGRGRLEHPPTSTMGQALGAIARTQAISELLALGTIRSVPLRITPEMLDSAKEEPGAGLLTYEVTPFGRALAKVLSKQIGLSEPTIKERMDALVADMRSRGAV